MNTPDQVARPALPDRARSFRWRYYAARTLLVLSLLTLSALLPNHPRVEEKYRYRIGDIARERVVAPYDFRVQKDEASLRREQQSAASAVPPVFVVDARVSSETLDRLAQYQERVLQLVLDAALTPQERIHRLQGLGVPLSDESARALAAPGRARRVLRDFGGWLNDLFIAGVVAEKQGGLLQGYRSIALRDGDHEQPRSTTLLYDRREALGFVERRARESYPGDPGGVRLVAEMAGPFVQANIVYDRAETEWRRVQAQGTVTTMLGFVQKDELIVDANQRIGRDALLKLHSLRDLEAARKQRGDLLSPPAARMALMILFIAMFAVYLRLELPHVFRDNAMLAMFTLLTLVVMGSTEVLVGVLGLSEFTIPLAVAPLVVASLMEKRPALVFTLMLAVATAAIMELKALFVPVAVVGGVTAVYSVARLRHRWHFLRANIIIALAISAAIVAWDLARATPAEVLVRDLMWGALNSFLSTVLAFLMLPVVEHVLGLTSDITLLELSDLNRPLLRRLQLEAPGTYHHSMIVGSLAERAAEATGANSLLARVSAYYHDIGKLAKPEYYAENEPAAGRSRHEQLAPSMSALVVRSHITEGLEMARRERLPYAVRMAIPEHHGTMVMAFFYDKALQVDPTVRREEYCYPGPRPHSKETAILMLADGVEGASRALQEPTPSRIRGLVTRIIDERVRDGQLDECGLTLAEVARIREAFVPVLTAIFHVRAPYPEEVRRRARADADLRKEQS
ncbi:MAG TPA: HDIG domain-containing protein [Candidatus Eisenbacteria bacterium]|nr:HDIG domain-containing protein [Candidatus Eisenbacteria bacterium]